METLKLFSLLILMFGCYLIGQYFNSATLGLGLFLFSSSFGYIIKKNND